MTNAAQRAEELRLRRNRREVDAIVADFPPLPEPLLRVLYTIADEGTCFAEVRALLDGVGDLKERIIRIANSPFYSPREPIETLDRAAVMLGQRHLNSLAVGAALQPYFDRPHAGYGHEAFGLWQHSVAVATAGGVIAEGLGAGQESCAEIYVAGLFHDIGKLVIAELLRRAGSTLELIDTPDEPPGLAELERETLGICHAEAGALLAARWQLEPSVADLIADHHQPGPGARRELAILHFSDHLLATLGVGFHADLPPETPLVPSALDCFEGAEDFLPVCEQHALRETARALSIVDALR